MTAFAKLSDRLVLLGSLVLSGLIQFSLINKASIWHDEGYTMLLAPQAVIDILVRTARDVHPPLHYLLLHFWMKLFGESAIAARSLSVVLILGSMAVAFLLVKHLFGSQPARVTVLLLAVAPFMVRYGIEARMYALAAFLLITATYYLVMALDTNSRRRLYLYALFMALAFYTHYYAIFMVPIHWLYVASRTGILRDRSHKVLQTKLLKWLPNSRWWLANALIVGLFAPWLPFAYAQFTRVQGGFWIPPVTLTTLPATVGQYFVFKDLAMWPLWLRLGLPLSLLALWGSALALNRLQRSSLFLVGLYAFLPPVAVFTISLISRPVYIDRYFVYSAVAFYVLLAVLLFVKPLATLRPLRVLIITLLLAVSTFGIRNVYLQANHQMRDIGQVVTANYQSGDAIIAGELYVYLDFSYYNQTPETTKLYAPGGINGYGETSLLYDQADTLVVKDYSQVNPASGTVWLVGKTGDKEYFNKVPAAWKLLERYQAKESVVQRYQITTVVQ